MLNILNFSGRNKYLLRLAEMLGHSVISEKITEKTDFKSMELCVSSYVYNAHFYHIRDEKQVSKKLRKYWKS